MIALAIGAGASLVGLALHAVLASVVRRRHRRTAGLYRGLPFGLSHLLAPFRLLLPALALAAATPLLPEPGTIRAAVAHFALLCIIAGTAWALTATFAVAHDLIVSRQRLEAADNLRARQIYTQLRVFERIAGVIVIVLAVATMLMTFSQLEPLGATLLESAGIAGIIAGLAAQRSLGTLFAGMQLALSQPIRLDDVVVVEGQWGRVEEITLTYVVVRVWDHRRLVLPATYFIEKPFENWTRTTAALLGTVYIYADYSVQVQPIRDALRRFVEETPLWDHNACGLQVTNASENTVELRALVSAANSSDLWDLRCEVREKLIAFIEASYPDRLPKTRVTMEQSSDGHIHQDQERGSTESRRLAGETGDPPRPRVAAETHSPSGSRRKRA